MINFKDDGEFKAPDASGLAGHAIIGLGTAGVNIVDQIMLDHRDGDGLFGFDTDEQVIRGSVLGDTMLLGAARIHGMGTGGDPALAAEIMRGERGAVADLLQGVRSVVLVAGLGGGTGSGMTAEFCQILKQLGAAVIVVAVTPFAFEGRRRLQQAAETLTVIRRHADAVLCLSNGRLAGLSQEVSVRGGFAVMNGLVGRMCLNLRAALNQKGPMQIHLADVRNLLAEHDCGGATLENCWTGFSASGGGDRAHTVVDEVLGSPLFADGQVWKRGAAVIACLGGGKDLSMGEFQETVEYLRQEIPVELPILAGTVLEPYETDALSLTLMVVGQTETAAEQPRTREEFAFEPKPVADRQREVAPPAPEPLADADLEPEPALSVSGGSDLFGYSERKGTEQKYFVQQEELPLDKKIYRGRFEKSAPTIFNGADLDQPTFMRLGVTVRV